MQHLYTLYCEVIVQKVTSKLQLLLPNYFLISNQFILFTNIINIIKFIADKSR